ncbi:Ras guanyl-releasing protein 3 [Rhizophlyctis rosea]|uniref:Ras guanyl-releasing protein 3 n=1 Tax=Rhizophlyctis rosea TaxID=64517 RepID=A0AAD5SGL2_9FUNG|nr:Ras guanyl-releasing protein 3 [Rhizophlyctis rosea]
MAAIDITIAEADRNLANVDLKTAFSLYFDAVALIASHIRSNTDFATPTENDPHAFIPGPTGPLRLKNWVVKQPEDIDRLFGLAHLCLTEVEDIINGDISADDLDPYGEDDGPLSLGRASPGSESKRVSTDRLSMNSREFRDRRLSRPRSVRSINRTNPRRHQSMYGALEKVDSDDGGGSLAGASIIDQGRRSATPDAISETSSPGPTFPSVPAEPPTAPAEESPTAPTLWDASAHRSNSSLQDNIAGMAESMTKSMESVEAPSGIGLENLPSPPDTYRDDWDRIRQRSSTNSQSPHFTPSIHSPSIHTPSIHTRTREDSAVSSNTAPSLNTSLDSHDYEAALDSHLGLTLPVLFDDQKQDTYLPLIPASPLAYQQQQLYDQYTQTNNHLRVLQEAQMARARTPSAASAQASEALSQIRRGMENSTVLKDRLTVVAGHVTAANGKNLFSFTPKQLALQLTAFDWEMFGFISLQDFMQYAANPSRPAHSIKSSLDFGYYVRRLVQTSIVGPEDVAVRGRVVAHWIDIASALFRLQNFQSLAAVVSGLASPPVGRLLKTWSPVPKKVKATLDDLIELLADTDGFKRYRMQIERCGRPAMPWLMVLFADSLTRNGFANARAQLEWFKGSDFNVLLLDKNPTVAHWIVSQSWMTEDQVMKASITKEHNSKDKKNAKKQAEAMRGRGVMGAGHVIYGRVSGEPALPGSGGGVMLAEIQEACRLIETVRSLPEDTGKKAKEIKAANQDLKDLMERLAKLKTKGE